MSSLGNTVTNCPPNAAEDNASVCIIVATHQNVPMPSDPLYLPIHVGKNGGAGFGLVGDDTGDNISYKNARYSELTGLYWAWKNLSADYVGCAHYRRLFKSLSKRTGHGLDDSLTLAQAQKLCQANDIILPRERKYYLQTLEEHFLSYSFAQSDDIVVFRNTIHDVAPEYIPSFDRVMKRRSGHMCNMFIMKKPLFDAYCAFLFNVIDALDATIAPARFRILGYYSEHLLDVWLDYNGYSYTEISALFLDSENEIRKRIAFLMRIAGFKEASDRFVGRQETF